MIKKSALSKVDLGQKVLFSRKEKHQPIEGFFTAGEIFFPNIKTCFINISLLRRWKKSPWAKRCIIQQLISSWRIQVFIHLQVFFFNA